MAKKQFLTGQEINVTEFHEIDYIEDDNATYKWDACMGVIWSYLVMYQR